MHHSWFYMLILRLDLHQNTSRILNNPRPILHIFWHLETDTLCYRVSIDRFWNRHKNKYQISILCYGYNPPKLSFLMGNVLDQQLYYLNCLSQFANNHQLLYSCIRHHACHFSPSHRPFPLSVFRLHHSQIYSSYSSPSVAFLPNQ
ncbi:hypothetical protein D3C72_1779570 [compost metagenome]